MSIFWVIFVIFSPGAFASSLKKKLNNIFKKWKTDDRPHDRTEDSGRARELPGETQKVYRLDLDALRGYRFGAFFAARFIYKPQVQPDRSAIGANFLWANAPENSLSITLICRDAETR